jgi:methyl-CpG-binding domain protein 4
MNHKWTPPRSPFGLLQEDLWPNEWMILISCMMLNQTSRKQVERVLPEFAKRWPTPGQFIRANRVEIYEVCRSLGFANKRSDNMMKMTHEYLAAPWQHARDLYGIGEYGARSWEIFCQGIIGDEVPNDHALTDYWRWYKQRVELT